MKILVTGKNGQLASEIHSISSNSSASFIFLDSTQGDITNKEKLDRIVQENAIDIIINCAAYTAVDKAETEKEKAYAVNHLGVQNLVEICSKYGTRLIHISTDYVFDGKENSPYVTEHPVSPTGIYGKSKEQGEKAIIESTVSAVIIRTSWVFSSFGNNFVKTMLRLGSERDQLNVVNDQFGCPTYAKDLAVTCLKIALKFQPSLAEQAGRVSEEFRRQSRNRHKRADQGLYSPRAICQCNIIGGAKSRSQPNVR